MEGLVTEYALVGGEGEKELVREVNSYIRSGYQPLGGPLIYAPLDRQPVLFQAMVVLSRQP